MNNPTKIIHKILTIDYNLLGIEYLKQLIKNISLVLKVKYVLVGHPINSKNEKVQTDLVWAKDKFINNLVYDLEHTPCQEVLCGNRTCYIENNVDLLYPKDKMLKEMNIKSYIGIPTIYGNKKLSSLLVILDDKVLDNRAFYESIIEVLAMHISSVLERIDIEDRLQKEIKSRTKELENINEKLNNSLSEINILKTKYENESKIDALTSTSNKQNFLNLAQQQIRISKRYKYSSSCLFIDIDFFKKVNDTYGHLVGDKVLKEVVLRIKSCIRESDLLARFGGEEFILLLPIVEDASDLSLANKIREKIYMKNIILDDISIKLSVSIGIFSTSKSNYILDDLISQADSALYKAKNAGRNNVKRF